MSELTPFLVIGITNGSIYSLAAMGLVLTYRTSGIFNFAHGAQAALAAYLMFEFRDRMTLPWPVAALLSLLLAGVVAGLVLERVAWVLGSASVAARVAATVALFVAIQGTLVAVFGPASLPMRYFLPTRVIEIGGASLRVEQVIVTAVVLLATATLYVFLSRARLGVATQAVVDDPVLLASQGTSPIAVRRAAWVIGSCFASISGMLLAPTTGLETGVLTLLVFYAFGAAAIGSFSSFPLTYVGGIVLGVGAALLTKYLNTTSAVAALPSTLPFLVLFGALLVTPKAKLVERGGQALQRFAAPSRLVPRYTATATVLAAAALLVVPHVVGPRLVLYTAALAFVVLFASLNLLVRTSGQVALCHMTFASVGAVTFAHVQEAGAPWVLAVLAAAAVAVPVGAIVAVPAIRLSGVYLAVATFGFGVLVQTLFFPSWLMFGRSFEPIPVSRPHVGWLHTDTDTGYYHVVLVVAVVCCAVILAIRRGRLGRLLRGLSEAPAALDAHGANTNVTRLWVFCFSAALAAVAGAVLSPVTGLVAPGPYHYSVSLVLVAVLFMAGRQPLLGAFVAAVAYVVVPSYIDDGTVQRYLPVAFGVGGMVAAMVGAVPVLERVRSSRRSQERVARSPVRRRWEDAAAELRA